MPELRTSTDTTSAPPVALRKKAPGLSFRRLFTAPGVSPYDGVD